MEIKNLISNKGNVINDLLIINPKVFEDNRGYFYESWNQSSFNKSLGKEITFLQDNHSRLQHELLYHPMHSNMQLKR